jgi:Holliday junction DNA helicase RuvA
VISSIRGEVLSIDLDHAVVEVGGVGLAVHAVPATLATLRRGEQARLTTALVVREDSLTLYGFADPEARGLFGLLQTVSGVGPRLALATLAVLDPETLRGALAEGDLAVLTSVPGIGRKGAERLVVELRDKVGAVAPRGTADPASGGGATRIQVVGFAVRQAEQAVEAVLGEGSDGGHADTSAVLRSALSRLGRNR